MLHKKDIEAKAAAYLRSIDARKPVSIPSQNYYISDDSGNSKKFVVKPTDKAVSYNATDVKRIVDAFLIAIEDSIKEGEIVSIGGLGTFKLDYKPAREVYDINNRGGKVKVSARFVPKFLVGPKIRTAAQIYTESVKDAITANAFPSEEDIVMNRSDN